MCLRVMEVSESFSIGILRFAIIHFECVDTFDFLAASACYKFLYHVTKSKQEDELIYVVMPVVDYEPCCCRPFNTGM